MTFEQTIQIKKENSSEQNKLDKELEGLYNADQSDRKSNLFSTNKELYLRNEETRADRAREIYQLYLNKQIELGPLSISHLAMIFQHRDKPEDYKVAYELAKKAVEGGAQEAKWLQAAAEDRYLVSIGQKQKWGTQFQKIEQGWQYWGELATDEESGITDEMRTEMGVPKRDEQMAKIAEKYSEK